MDFNEWLDEFADRCPYPLSCFTQEDLVDMYEDFMIENDEGVEFDDFYQEMIEPQICPSQMVNWTKNGF